MFFVCFLKVIVFCLFFKVIVFCLFFQDDSFFFLKVIVPEEANSMLLGSAMLGMAAGEVGGLETVVRRLQRISKVNLTNNQI